jgi:hypothetical protein
LAERRQGEGSINRSALGIWRNPKAVQELELTDDQVAQLKDSDFATREKKLKLKSQLDGYRLEMEKVFSAKTSTKMQFDSWRER